MTTFYDDIYNPDSSIYNYDRQNLAKFLGFTKKQLDTIFTIGKLQKDTTFNTAVDTSKIVFVVASALGVASNMFCIFLFMSMKGPLRTSIKLLLTLSICDAVRSTLDVVWFFYPYSSARFISRESMLTLRKTTYHDILRRGLTSVNILTDIAGLVTTIMLAVVIFLAVRKPMTYNSLMSSRRHSIGISLFIWTTSGSMVICFNCILQVMIHDQDLSTSTEIMVQAVKVYYSLFFAYRYMVMGISGIIMLLNIAIYIQVRISTVKSTYTKRRRRFILILVMITACFFITNIPYFFQIFRDDANSLSELYANKFLMYSYYCMPFIIIGWRSLGNTIVYTVRLPEIRKQVLTVFCPQRVKRLQRQKTVVNRLSDGKMLALTKFKDAVGGNVK